ncbi:2,5-dioxovalerate dehydrogenase [Natronorubrum aibiense]|uniref:Aldehyde dehydrogenase family protein n=1 Tax=Natronorubrum aibiense TaxID=348826 RepID=A0A5P9PA19_9EURY|nr:aldehyde dehydrogenase family protein [Natronorubrum aibiense]QFU84710.1 aldehyde dehydrogenase family protein [Natronorubrum aibiense]
MAVQQRKNYCNGEWIESDSEETFSVTNPADGSVVAQFPKATGADAERAIQAAVGAQDAWAETPGPERGAVLRRAAGLLEDRAEDVAKTLTLEEGKTLAEATGEVQRAVDILYYYAEKASDLAGDAKASSDQNSRLRTVMEPVGVVGLITPWNYPIAIPTWKVVPALAAGNTVVLKPASQAPTVAHELADCLDEAGLPDGVLNVVTGSGSEVGSTITSHEAVDAISFTGSSAVGELVRESAAETGARIQLEMGGKNPAVVMPSADIDEAVDIVGAGAFGVTGQACTATSRAIVHESIYDEFVERLADYANDIEIGPGLEAEMGPQVSASELESTLDYIEIGKEEGATLEAGGDVPTVDGDGHYVEPTVFSDVESEMRIAREEIFGPVVAVIPVSDFKEAVVIANDSQYGLAASVITENLSEANRFIDKVEAGVVKINEKTTGLELHVPFGGTKRSSSETWREQGDAGLDFYTTTKTVYLNY